MHLPAMHAPAIHMHAPAIHMHAPAIHIHAPAIHIHAPAIHMHAPAIHMHPMAACHQCEANSRRPLSSQLQPHMTLAHGNERRCAHPLCHMYRLLLPTL